MQNLSIRGRLSCYQQSRPFESWVPGEALPTLTCILYCTLMQGENKYSDGGCLPAFPNIFPNLHHCESESLLSPISSAHVPLHLPKMPLPQS